MKKPRKREAYGVLPLDRRRFGSVINSETMCRPI